MGNQNALNVTQHKIEIEETKPDNMIRFVCISDTHTKTNNLSIPDGDVLIHAGDFTYTGQANEVSLFNTFLKGLPHKYKVVIAGNHEITFDKERYNGLKKIFALQSSLDDMDKIKNSLEDVIYLEDSSVNILGYEIYGSPYSNQFYEWAFMESEEKLKDIWAKIPSNTDVLITHGPPKYIGDFTTNKEYAGSETLLQDVANRIKPKYHIFGHIHEGYGVYKTNKTDDTIFINCSLLNENYRRTQLPIVFDLPIKEIMFEK